MSVVDRGCPKERPQVSVVSGDSLAAGAGDDT
jgi:hypothetical protein